MTREEKAAAVSALHDRFAKASVALVATNKGLTVGQSTRLRRVVRAAGGEYKVAKHTLARRALAETRYGRLADFFVGPRALVFGYTDPVAVAKALVDFAGQNDKIQIEGGAVEGQVIQAEQVKAFATMPDLGSLRARVARLAMSPGQRVASMVVGPAGRIAGAIEAFVKKLEGAGA